tara:strand:+ start:177 stop:401 length:225 start_codon:yes stop_codon:yes gene_type:complete
MAKTKDKQPLLTLDEKHYFKEDLSDEQIRMVAHLENVESKLQSNGFIQEQLGVTKEALIEMLQKSINKEEKDVE